MSGIVGGFGLAGDRPTPDPEVRPPAGWYPDQRGQRRYWDGSAWTEHVQPENPQPGTQPALQPAQSLVERVQQLTGTTGGQQPGPGQPPLDPAYCPQCGNQLGRGYMACPACGATILRSRYPMNGDWNRRLTGIAVSGWGWDLATGSPVNLVFTRAGITVQYDGGAATRPWGDISDMAVTGPGTQSHQGFQLIPTIDLSNLTGTAINLGLEYLTRKITTTTTTRTLFTFVGPSFELVVFSDGVDTTALRWQLAPAFSCWRRAQHDRRVLMVRGAADDLDQIPERPREA